MQEGNTYNGTVVPVLITSCPKGFFFIRDTKFFCARAKRWVRFKSIWNSLSLINLGTRSIVSKKKTGSSIHFPTKKWCVCVGTCTYTLILVSGFLTQHECVFGNLVLFYGIVEDSSSAAPGNLTRFNPARTWPTTTTLTIIFLPCLLVHRFDAESCRQWTHLTHHHHHHHEPWWHLDRMMHLPLQHWNPNN